LTELGKVNRSTAVHIHLVDHVQQLLLRRILAQRAHCDTQLLGRDGAVAVLKKLNHHKI
jgi:hypothetical protein